MIIDYDKDQLSYALANALKERDEAREKMARQADRIRYLEGATNHAEGTPLSIALKERDEAREELHDIRLNLGADAEGYTLAVCVLQQRDQAVEDKENSRQSLGFALEELNEARAVADELSAIAARYLGWHLSRTPMGPDDDHLAQASRITETLARWKALASA